MIFSQASEIFDIDAFSAMELALSLEKLVDEKLLKLHSVAGEANDPQSQDFIESESLAERVEAIKMIFDFVTQLRMVGKGHVNRGVGDLVEPSDAGIGSDSNFASSMQAAWRCLLCLIDSDVCFETLCFPVVVKFLIARLLEKSINHQGGTHEHDNDLKSFDATVRTSVWIFLAISCVCCMDSLSAGHVNTRILADGSLYNPRFREEKLITRNSCCVGIWCGPLL
ncbi:Ferritin-1, chloroplastic-like protein [Drosera capensis]